MKLSLALVVLLAANAGAIMPSREDGDAKRFGLEKLGSVGPRLTAGNADKPVRDYNGSRRSGTMSPAAIGSGSSPAPSNPRQAADAFLRDRGPSLNLDHANLVYERASDGGAHKHALYSQTYRGLPVEFAKVKVHFDANWAVMGVDSDYDSTINVEINPAKTDMEARAAAIADAGGGEARRSELVVLTDPARQKPARLAWRVRVLRNSARWRYWIDANTGEVALRVNDVRQLGPCTVMGTMKGEVYDLDPQLTPLQVRDFTHQRVFIGDGTQYTDTQLDTDVGGLGNGKGSGFYCSTNIGKIFTQLQGPYVNVANFNGPSAHWDNGAGVWTTIATPVSSPHPYTDNTVHTSTIDLSGGIAPGAVKFLPVFTNMNVGIVSGGDFGEGSNIADNDQVQIVDQFDRVVASYVGNKGSFRGTAVPGTLMRLRTVANESGVQLGYDVALSSYLSLTSPFTVGVEDSLMWTTTHTANGLRAEPQLFYHLNIMRDYLAGVAGTAGAAKYLNRAVNAMVHVGPSLVNAQYEPSTDNLFFGDVSAALPSDVFVEDATVPRHEYTHYFVEKIYSPQNFGQAGAISEGVADYFSGSSFGNLNGGISSIGRYVVQSFGGTGSLRELDCPTKTACSVLVNGNWLGEIHDDSIFLSQALWDIRKDRVSLQGYPNGANCVDGLVYNALLFFPESFQEFLQAMLRVDAAGLAVCGGASAVQSTILSRFGNHGVILPSGTNDPYDVTLGLTIRHNDGFETAVDITTVTPVSGTIFPAADLDFFSFGAGAGPMQLRLDLPSDGNGFYKAYSLTLFDSRHRLVAEAHPRYDGINTENDLCKEADCTTTNDHIVLNYTPATPGLHFLQISGGPTNSGGSNSGVNSAARYTLSTSITRAGALTGTIVTAQLDSDVIGFNVRVTSWPHQQDWRFSYAQLRDHAQNVIPLTYTCNPGLANCPVDAASRLLLLGATNANGVISGTVRLQNGFSQRFPSLGTVHLEVFGYNVYGSTHSLGFSNAVNLTTSQSDAKAWNNVFNPARGGKTTIKYDVVNPGHLRVRLYTLSGQFISTLYDGQVTAGKGAIDWAGRNFAGNVVASGIYLVRIEGPGVDKVLKVAVVK